MQSNLRIATVDQTAALYPAFKQSSLRWLIFHEETNGFKTCIRRIGRRIYIDLDKFEAWISQHA